MITGREKDVMNLGGDKVKPEMVEEVVASFSGIDQVAPPGGSFTQPVVVQLTAAEAPAAGMQVQFTFSGAPLTLAPDRDAAL